MKKHKYIEDFENKISFKFKNKDNLIKALTHPSSVKKSKNTKLFIDNDFERLEFLGDRVLGLSIAHLIFDKFLLFNEGNLTKKLSYLVQKDFLYKIALEIEIEKVLNYSYIKENIRMNKSVLADSVESLIGSIFIDSGFNASLKFIKNIWGPYLSVEASNKQDPKTKLQEMSQQKNKSLPLYSLVEKKGPSHSPLFTVSLKVLNLPIIKGSGKSKREAEKNAAIYALDKFNDK